MYCTALRLCTENEVFTSCVIFFSWIVCVSLPLNDTSWSKSVSDPPVEKCWYSTSCLLSPNNTTICSGKNDKKKKQCTINPHHSLTIQRSFSLLHYQETLLIRYCCANSWFSSLLEFDCSVTFTGPSCPLGATDPGFEAAATCPGCLGPAAAINTEIASLLSTIIL